MQHEGVKVGEFTFMLRLPEDQELMPSLQIENEASRILETVDIEQALRLKELLEDYLKRARDS